MDVFTAAAFLSRFKFTYRKIWNKFGISHIESHAEHSFYVSLLCLYFAEINNLNSSKMLQMTLIHAIPSILVLDFPCFLSKECASVFERNREAILSSISNIFTDPSPVLDLIDEYYKQKSPLSQKVFQLKVLETLLQVKRLHDSNTSLRLESLEKILYSYIIDPKINAFKTRILG